MNWARRGIRLLKDTPIEIALMGVLGAAIATGTSWHHESNREKRIPLGFSEIRQIEKKYETEDKPVPPFTHYLMSTNDATMKVFECWNIANKRAIIDSPYEYFAQELENVTGPNQHIYGYNLEEFLTILPERAQAALGEFKNFTSAAIQIDQANSNLDRAWSESHVNHYRTETYTETETYTGGDGKMHTRIVTKTRQVYDHTTHSYTYRKENGEVASAQLDSTIASHPDLVFTEAMPFVAETGAENEYAMDTSRKKSDERMDQAELLQTANTWNTGSTLNVNLPTVCSTWSSLHQDADSWRNAKSKAHSTTYITYSSYDSGPREFQTAKTALGNGREFVNATTEIANGPTYVIETSPSLLYEVKNFIAVELDNKPGNGKKAGRKVLDTAIEMYKTNFKGGFEVDRFRGYMPAIFGVLGLLAGGAAGAGLNHLGDKYKWYETRRISSFLTR